MMDIEEPEEVTSHDMTQMDDLSNDIQCSRIDAPIEIPLSPLNEETSQSGHSQLMSGDESASKSLLMPNCYCERERDLSQIELQCARCLKWFHTSCITVPIGRCLQFMTNYTFLCKSCSPTQMESFSRRQTNFSQMCETAIANLMNVNPNRTAFSRDKEIIPFIEHNWDILTTMPRRVKQTWHNTVNKTMQKESDIFMCDNRDHNDPLFALRYGDLFKVGPNYENAIKSSISGKQAGEVGRGGFGRWAKKRVPGGLSHLEGSEYFTSKKAKSDLSHPKLPPNGFPTEHPFNKDGYRYILAEPDPHSPCRQEFEDSQDWAGKPIPGWLCRKLIPERIMISMHDRAPQLKISEDRLTVTGEKGYCMVRSTHGVSRGVWYFEVNIDEMPDGSATRIGWAQEMANLQAPLGYDKFGYSWRSRKGTKFYQSKGLHFSDTGYGHGDTIGFLIDLPHPTLDPSNKNFIVDEFNEYLPQTYKDKPLVKFKSYFYFEEKEEPQKAIKTLKPLPGSKMIYYKNGVKMGIAWENINAGIYYPSISLYKSCIVTFNFGPKFKYPPKDVKFRAMSELSENSQIEQTMSDMLYFIENDGKLRLDSFYGIN